MGPFSTPGPLWRDRDADDQGTPLRADVRQAAKVFWPDACLRTRNLLGEDTEATELLERSVSQVSHELDYRDATPFREDVSSALCLRFCKELICRAARRGFVQQCKQEPVEPTAKARLGETGMFIEWPQKRRNSSSNLLEKNGCWLDRCSVDGIVLRSDVRTAAELFWTSASCKTREAMGSSAETAALMEKAVAEASQYLDERRQETCLPRARALLKRIFCRLLMHRAEPSQQFRSVGEVKEHMAPVLSWEERVNDLVFLGQLARHMSPEEGNMLTFFLSGFKWPEMARMYGTTVTAIKKRFWREIEHAKIKLGITSKKATAKRKNKQRRR